jgi:ribonuclease G
LSKKDAGSVGDVVLGKVTRVLPGLQAAFIDIGQERAAFLHVEDLIRPDDFDTYLAGGRKHAKEDDASDVPLEVTGNEEIDAEAEADLKESPPNTVGAVEPGTDQTALAGDEPMVTSGATLASEEEASGGATLAEGPDSLASLSEPSLGGGEAATDERQGAPPWSDPDLDALLDDEEDEEESDGDDGPRFSTTPSDPDIEAHDRASSPDTLPPATLAEDRAREHPVESARPAGDLVPPGENPPLAPVTVPRSARRHSPPVDDLFDMPGFTVSEPGEPSPRAPARPRAEKRDGWREAGGRRRGRGRGGRLRAAVPVAGLAGARSVWVVVAYLFGGGPPRKHFPDVANRQGAPGKRGLAADNVGIGH